MQRGELAFHETTTARRIVFIMRRRLYYKGSAFHETTTARRIVLYNTIEQTTSEEEAILL